MKKKAKAVKAWCIESPYAGLMPRSIHFQKKLCWMAWGCFNSVAIKREKDLGYRCVRVEVRAI